MKPNSLVLWQGQSLVDGAPLIVIASGLRESKNAKTGNMVQTYILRADVSPLAAVKVGADVSICGACVHRGAAANGIGRTCYVQVGNAPEMVWNAWQRGRIPAAGNAPIAAGRTVRLGTYGDPAAVPVNVWHDLLRGSVGRTGYTHQWRTAWIDTSLRALVMASADTPDDRRDAIAAGWRTFRVALPSDPARLPGEAVCPASAEAGKKLTCAQCLACSGADGRRGTIVIAAHGGFAVMANVKRRVAASWALSI